MKQLIPFLLLLCGCSYSKPLLCLPHADGSGYTQYRSIHVGGVIRPGIVVIVAERVGSNGPVVLSQASGSPLLPSVVSASGIIGAAATLGATLPENDYNNSTVIQNPPHAPMMEPPRPPSPPPVHPPNGRPPNNRPHSGAVR